MADHPSNAEAVPETAEPERRLKREDHELPDGRYLLVYRFDA